SINNLGRVGVRPMRCLPPCGTLLAPSARAMASHSQEWPPELLPSVPPLREPGAGVPGAEVLGHGRTRGRTRPLAHTVRQRLPTDGGEEGEPGWIARGVRTST